MTIGRIATLVVACTLALAGCAENQETETPSDNPSVVQPSAGSEPEPEPSETATPYPTDELPERLADLVSEPVLPDAAREFTTEGAAAFAEFVIDAANWAYATGDASILLAHCSEESGFCSSVQRNSAQIHDEDLVRHGGQAIVEISKVEISAESKDALIDATVEVTPVVDVDAHGAIVLEFDAEDYSVTYYVTYGGGLWRLEAVASQ